METIKKSIHEKLSDIAIIIVFAAILAMGLFAYIGKF